MTQGERHPASGDRCRVGIVVPAFNAAATIAATLHSIIAQSYPDWAICVVDDGSTDRTAAIAAGMGDPRIRVLAQPNAGVSAARNRAIAALDCDAVLFLDADDWLAPDALARLAGTLAASPGAVAAYGAYAFVAEASEPGARPLSIRSGPFPEGDILQALLSVNLFVNGGHLLIRRAAISRAGGFAREIAFGEDWEYWVRLALLGPFAVVPGASPLLYVRQRAGSAYLRMAIDPAAFHPCMDAVFGSPTLRRRLGHARCDALRRRMEAENGWIIGREMMRHGRRRDGLPWLVRSVIRKPSARRAALLGLAHALPALPRRLRGPFLPYPQRVEERTGDRV